MFKGIDWIYDHVREIKKSLSDFLKQMEGKDSPMASNTSGKKLKVGTKPHNEGGKFLQQ